jgi:tetratricopeptide (TPR) repeat protein
MEETLNICAVLLALSIPGWLISVKDFALANPEWSLAILSGLAATGGAFWRWGVPRLWPQPPESQALEPSFPFDVIKPHSQQVLRRLMASEQAADDPLADFNIPYQLRREDVSIRQKIEGLLDVHRWLLILGRTGLGKTREAAELAARLNHEGWTLLRLKNHETLTVPTQFPAEVLGTQPRLLFVLDNLNQAMGLGTVVEADSGGLTAAQQPLQTRLQETLAFYENHCGADRVRVVATARNETEPDQPGQPSQWDKLAVEKYPQLWQRFHHYVIPEPSPQAVVAVLQQVTEAAQVTANPDDFEQIARCNDGTFRNVVENLERARNRRLTVSRQTYRENLRGTWASRYQAACQRDKRAHWLYDAVDLLRQGNVELKGFLVVATAAMLSNQTRWWQVWPRYQLKQSIARLQRTERILQPRDGQIEAKGSVVDLVAHFAALTTLVLQQSRQRPQAVMNSLAGLIKTAQTTRQSPQGLATANRLVSLTPKSNWAWFQKGVALGNLGRYEDAIAAWDAALAIKPVGHEALYNKGVALGNLGRHEDAIATWDAALAIKPDGHEAFNNKGVALDELGRYEEAIAAYDAALTIKPDYHKALNNKGRGAG